MKILITLVFLISTILAFDIKKDNKIIIKEIENSAGEYKTSDNYIFNDNSNLMVKFKHETPEKIKNFEETHSLELIQVFATGFYLYKIDGNILEKIDEILADDKNINTIFPDWKKIYYKY